MRQVRRVQRTFLLAGVAFLVALAVMVGLGSSGRTSVLSSHSEFGGKTGVVSEDSSVLRLQDFHRTEVRAGQTAWEIVARDAEYFVDKAVTQVNSARMKVFRGNDEPVQLEAAAASLYLADDSMKRTDLEGDIKVVVGDSLTVTTNLAVFDATTRHVTSPAFVKIIGPGYEIEGTGFALDLDTEVISLSRDVVSKFVMTESSVRNVSR